MDDWIAADWRAPPNIVAGTMLPMDAGTRFPAAGAPCWLNQVHGSDIVSAGRFDAPPEADGSVGEDTEFFSIVRTADCLPVLVCSSDGSVFGAAHAGWRGMAAGVIENLVARLNVPGSDLMAWLGPAISQPAFEVGEEVRDAFLAADSAAADCFEPNSRGRWQADLYALGRQRLATAGVSTVYGGGYCTFSESERFPSYRRDKTGDRLFSFVGLKGP